MLSKESTFNHNLFHFSVHSSTEEIEIVIKAIYKKVLGNAHIIESERLTVLESQFRNGDISVREFVRQLAKSELYRSLFFENCSNVRAIELNFKHLLGRAPETAAEIAEHTSILLEDGLEAEIDSYIDSQEYDENFGNYTVPYYVGYDTQTGRNVTGYNNIFKLTKSFCHSDRTISHSIKSSQASQLQQSLLKKAKATGVVDFASYMATEKVISKSKPSQLVPQFVPQNEYPVYNGFSSHPKWLVCKKQYQNIINLGPIEYIPGSNNQDIEVVIKALYKQVLGNAHVMESERLTTLESQLANGNLSVREFVRQLAKSELYRNLFFNNCPRYRSIELNFKHLLGRAPDDYKQTFHHSQILDQEGFFADIDSYIDSDEYQCVFGENIVPYTRGYNTQTGQKLIGFANMSKLLTSYSTSDKAGKTKTSSRIQSSLMRKEVYTTSITIPTDIQALLNEVLKPKVTSPPVIIPQAERVLQRQCQEQAELIQSLQADLIQSLEKQLRELQALASVGATVLGNWSTTPTPTEASNINNSNQDNLEIIATLKAKIADLERVAAFGDRKLNKWRNKMF